MNGIIFAGGYGSRMFPLTLEKPLKISRQKGIPEECFNINAVPKPLAPVTNYPVIYSQLSKLRLLGAQKSIVTVWCMGDKFQELIPKIEGMEIEVMRHVGSELEMLVWLSDKKIIQESDQVFVVMNGDIVSNIDPRPALDEHQRQMPLATIISTPLKGDETRFSAIGTEERGVYEQVRVYQHKTTFQNAKANKRNASIYFFHYGFFDWLKNSFSDLGKISLSKDIFPRLASEGQLFNYRTIDYWADIGELWDYIKVQYHSLRSDVDHPLVGRFYGNGRTYSENRYCVIGPSLISKNCEVGVGSIIGPNTIIGEGWKIGKNSYLKGSVLWPDYIGTKDSCFSIGNNVSLRGCLVGSGVIRESATNKVIVYNGEKTFMHDIV